MRIYTYDANISNTELYRNLYVDMYEYVERTYK